jgi:hypothetical protein
MPRASVRAESGPRYDGTGYNISQTFVSSLICLLAYGGRELSLAVPRNGRLIGLRVEKLSRVRFGFEPDISKVRPLRSSSRRLSRRLRDTKSEMKTTVRYVVNNFRFVVGTACTLRERKVDDHEIVAMVHCELREGSVRVL